jgi:hypothetical protein
MRPFSIRIFVPSGNPEGVRIISRDDWTGKAVLFPRALLGEVKGRVEYKQPGVYLLSGGKKLYIGEADPIGLRLEDHSRKKNFWTKAVFFTAEGGRLNKAHIQHLESRLVKLAEEAGLVELENSNRPQPPALSEEEHAAAENFLREILLMLPLIGFWQFDDDPEEEVEAEVEEQAKREVDGHRIGKRAGDYSNLPRGLRFSFRSPCQMKATLALVEGGVTVLEGSEAAAEAKSHFDIHGGSYAAKRRELIESGVLALQHGRYVFTGDQFFTSASAAASVIAGQNHNADHWQAEDGTNLGDLLRQARNRRA